MAPIAVTRAMDEYRRAQATLGGRVAAGASVLVRERLNVDDPDRGWASLLAALLELIRGGRSVSEELAMEFYRYLREAEEVAGDPPRKPDVEFPSDAVIGSMVYTGPRMAKAMKRRGDTSQLATRVGNAVGRSAMRHTLNGGRRVIQGVVLEDSAARGWARITDADPCDFCRMLASRGPVYKSARTAGHLHRYHDGCACSVVPMFWSEFRAQTRGLPSGEATRPGSRSRRGADGMTDRQRAVVEQVRREIEAGR